MTNAYRADAETLIEIYRRVALLHANDETVRKTIRSGKLAMVYYSYRGQEVIPAALSVSLRDDDYICTIYRGIHDMLAKGFPLKPLWAELAGKQEGACKGKGGPMHLTYPEKGVMVTTGIVGSTLPIANGLAWAAQLDRTDRVAVANFGDGASNIGAFHEALNMASSGGCRSSSSARTTATPSIRPSRPALRWRGSPTGAPPMACRASMWTATTPRRCMPPAARRWIGRAAAGARR